MRLQSGGPSGRTPTVHRARCRCSTAAWMLRRWCTKTGRGCSGAASRHDPGRDRSGTRTNGHRQAARRYRHDAERTPATLLSSQMGRARCGDGQPGDGGRSCGVHLPEVAKAAATAGIRFAALPRRRGRNTAYPAVARIGPEAGRELAMAKRSRASIAARHAKCHRPRLELRGRPDAHTWGFRPMVVGYIGNVRGVVTGLEDSRAPRPKREPFPFLIRRRIPRAVFMTNFICCGQQRARPGLRLENMDTTCRQTRERVPHRERRARGCL